MATRLWSWVRRWWEELSWQHRLFLCVQLATSILVVVLWVHLPVPGWAVAILAVVAAAMSVHGEMRGWQKAVWLLLIGALLVVELRSISKDRSESDARNLQDRKAQDSEFKSVRDAQDKAFQATAEGLKASYQLAQRQFESSIKSSNKTIGGIETNLEAVTGSKSFPSFWVSSNPDASGRYQLTLVVMGTYPMEKMSAAIQVVESRALNIEMPKDVSCIPCLRDYMVRRQQSGHRIMLDDSDTLPNLAHVLPETLPLGEYQIDTYGVSGIFTEMLTLQLNEKGELSQKCQITKAGNPMMIVVKDQLVPAHIEKGKLVPVDKRMAEEFAKQQ